MAGSTKMLNRLAESTLAANVAIRKLEEEQLHLKQKVELLLLERAEQSKGCLKDVNSKKKPIKEGSKFGGSNDDDDDDEKKLRDRLLSTIVMKRPSTKWSDVAGLEKVKQTVTEAVIMPLRSPHLFIGSCKPWKGILLFGPPGNGKTLIAEAVATEARASTFFSVKLSDLITKWLGDSEKLVDKLFTLAREHKPSIIFIDEVDGLSSARSDDESDTTLRIKNAFMAQMQSVSTDNDNVLVLGATNRPWAIDVAIMRRFERRIYVPLPDSYGRFELFRLNVEKNYHTLIEQDYETLVQRTNGYSGHDISQIIKDASMQPIRQAQVATHFKRVRVPSPNNPAVQYDMWTACSPNDPSAKKMSYLDFNGDELAVPQMTMQDVIASLQIVKPTVNNADLAKFEQYNKDLGDSKRQPWRFSSPENRPETSKVSNCVLALRVIYALLQVGLLLSVVITLLSALNSRNRINGAIDYYPYIPAVLYLLTTVIVAFAYSVIASGGHSVRKTWLLILEGFRQFMAASLVLAMLLPDRAPLPLGGSVLCFFSLISMILFLSLQVTYCLHPKRTADEKTAKVDETILLEDGLRPELNLENRNGADAALQTSNHSTLSMRSQTPSLHTTSPVAVDTLSEKAAANDSAPSNAVFEIATFKDLQKATGSLDFSCTHCHCKLDDTHNDSVDLVIVSQGR
ncbi:hypothetical protein WR25_16743 isoform J [Diploscapter pachys]|nr:hypothetical protein WR25_16743 isoform J [Diploscapter pachys]